MSISHSSLLADLSISVWTANKLDRSQTDKVTGDNKAVRNAAQVRKNLMAGTDMRKKISDYAAACRVWHQQRTLPWADRGTRLIPLSLFMDYKQEANGRRDQFNSLVDAFILEYPNLVQLSQSSLGSLFNVDDYPDANEIKSKFGFSLVFSPVPESGDFRLDIPTQDLEEMKQEYEQSFNGRLADAMREPWERLHTTLTHISGRLTDKVGDNSLPEKTRYHDTMLTNAIDLCGMLTHLNVTNDPELDRARRMLEAVLLGADIETIKESPEFRAGMKSKVDGILKQFQW